MTIEYALQMNDVKFRWPDTGHFSLDIKEFKVLSGSTTFLRGPSGAGKSTLLNLIAGVILPQKGSIKILNNDISEMSIAKRDHFRGNNLGFVFQMFNLLPYLNVFENVELPCHFSKDKKTRLPKGTSMRSESSRLLSKLKIDPELYGEKKINRLSVGQQQRVAAARALMGRPPMIVADEPTSALDDATKNLFMKLLFSEISSYGATLLFVSHDLTLSDYFDEAIDLEQINSRSS